MDFKPKLLTTENAGEILGVENLAAFDFVFNSVLPILARDQYRRGTFEGSASEFLGANLGGRMFVMVEQSSPEMPLAKTVLRIDRKYYRAIEIKRSLVSGQN